MKWFIFLRIKFKRGALSYRLRPPPSSGLVLCQEFVVHCLTCQRISFGKWCGESAGRQKMSSWCFPSGLYSD